MSEEKPLLIIIPSPLILARTYNRLAKEFSDIYEVQIANLPGTGLNSSHGKVWDDSAYAEHLHKALRLIDSNVFLLGHSNSGTIAAKLANMMPEKVAGLILADTTGTGRHSYFRSLLGRAFDGIYEMKFSSWAVFHLLTNVLFHPLNFVYQIHLSIKNDVSDEFEQVKVTTFLMWGKRDHTMPLKDALRLKRSMKESRLLLSEKGSHDWVLTNVREFTDQIKHHLMA